MKKRQILTFLLSLLIGLAVFFIVIRKVGADVVKQALALFFGFEGWIIILLTFAMALVAIMRWRLIFKSQGHHFSLRKLTPLWLVGFAMSYLTPVAFLGGEVFRIFFTVKKLPVVSVKKTIASVTIDRILDATVFFVFLIIGILVFTVYGRLPATITVVGIAMVAGLLLVLLLVFYFKRAKRQSMLEWFLKIFRVKRSKVLPGKNGSLFFEAEKEVFHFFSLKHRAFWQALLLTFLRYGLLFLRCALLVFFLVGNIGALKALAIYGFANLASLAPVPAALGALELGQGFAFNALGLGFSTGTVFSMIWRGADLLLCFFGLFFLIKFGSYLLQTKILSVFDKD